MRQEIHIPSLGPAISHYTEAVRFGDLLYVSGLVSCDSEGKIVAPNDPVGQTRQIFKIMKVILDEVGAGFGDVLKLNLFLTDIDDRPLINPIRRHRRGGAPIPSLGPAIDLRCQLNLFLTDIDDRPLINPARRRCQHPGTGRGPGLSRAPPRDRIGRRHPVQSLRRAIPWIPSRPVTISAC